MGLQIPVCYSERPLNIGQAVFSEMIRGLRAFLIGSPAFESKSETGGFQGRHPKALLLEYDRLILSSGQIWFDAALRVRLSKLP